MSAESLLPPDADLDGELRFALELADLADAQTLHRYEARSFTIDRKADRTEVTEADRGAETAISDHLVTHRPLHGLYGEEHGKTGDRTSAWQWIVDPVDGTSNFVRGIPVWATLIALTYNGEVVVGVVSAPALGRRWWAALGRGAFWGPVGPTRSTSPPTASAALAMRVSAVDNLAEAQVCVTFSAGWDKIGLTGELVALQQNSYRARGFGDFWQHMLVAEGAVDIAIDAIGLQPYDLAAVQIIVEEAGGAFTDRTGRRTYEADSAISSNGMLHDAVITRLRGHETR